MVFVLPPSMEELARRLRGRGTDEAEVVKGRLDAAREEMRHAGRYDYLLVNEDLDVAYDRLRCIYQAARTSRRCQTFRLERLVGAQ